MDIFKFEMLFNGIVTSLSIMLSKLIQTDLFLLRALPYSELNRLINALFC